MPIPRFDAASSHDTGPGVDNPLTFAHTCGANAKLLIVGVSIRTTAGQIVNGITYNAVALTKLEDKDSATPDVRAEFWYLKNPATGAPQNIIVTLSAAARFCAGGISLESVNLNTTFGTQVEAIGDSQLATVNVVSNASELVVDVMGKQNTANAVTVGAGQTQRYKDETRAAATANDSLVGGSTEPGANPTTMSWSWANNNREWAIIAVGVRGAPSGTKGYIIG